MHINLLVFKFDRLPKYDKILGIMMNSIDELDAFILIELQKDAKKHSEDIAKVLHTSSSTIRRRINRLIKEKILHIATYVSQPNIGRPITAVISFPSEAVLTLTTAISVPDSNFSIGVSCRSFSEMVVPAAI